ncbi:MAG: endonuclease III [Oscillospiraceae bacterium]|nr:endonuclease III [Oscillospiraceae bacterium]
MEIKEKALRAIEELKKLYPDALCSLSCESAFQLLVATRLSAQCTDARVNMITPGLFSKYPDAESMSKADVSEIENIVRPCGFYHHKARDIVEMSKMLVSDFGGKVPDEIEVLITLPGVGRKTANLIVGDVYGKAAIVADTHLIRISNRLGLVDSKDPLKVETQLRKIIPPEEGNNYCHRNVLHGRAVCDARKPKCEICSLNSFCKYREETKG